MFYLTFYFRFLKKSPLLLFLHFGLLSLIILNVLKANSIQKFVYLTFTENKEHPHFYAIMTKDINHSKIFEKLLKLPGIKNVELVDNNYIARQTESILSDLELNDLGNDSFDFIGIKVIFERAIKKKSMKLVQDYLKKITTKGHLIIGDIKNTSTNKNQSFIITHASIMMTSILCFFWLIINHQMAEKIRRNAYIVEQFQRKTSVALKTYTLTFFTFIAVPFLGAISFINVPILSLCLIFLVLVLGAIKYRATKWP